MQASDRWMFTMSDHSDTNLDANMAFRTGALPTYL